MSAFSERVEREDEEDRIGMVRARAAYDAVSMQLALKVDTTCEHDGYVSSYHSRRKAELKCLRCGKVWRTR